MAILHFVYPFIVLYEYLGCFYFSAIVNNTAMNNHIEAFVWTYVFSSLRYIFRNGIAGSFWGNARLFSTTVVPLCIPKSTAWRIQFLHIFTSTCYFILFILFYHNSLIFSLFMPSFDFPTLLSTGTPYFGLFLSCPWTPSALCYPRLLMSVELMFWTFPSSTKT